jgi:hypothetical protein
MAYHSIKKYSNACHVYRHTVTRLAGSTTSTSGCKQAHQSATPAVLKVARCRLCRMLQRWHANKQLRAGAYHAVAALHAGPEGWVSLLALLLECCCFYLLCGPSQRAQPGLLPQGPGFCKSWHASVQLLAPRPPHPTPQRVQPPASPS